MNLTGKYPNIDLMEFKCRQAAQEFTKNGQVVLRDIDAQMFSQEWASSKGGNATEPYVIKDSRMFRQYTTVFVYSAEYDNKSTKWATVFFEDKLAYSINLPNQKFEEDLAKKSPAGVFAYQNRYFTGVVM